MGGRSGEGGNSQGINASTWTRSTRWRVGEATGATETAGAGLRLLLDTIHTAEGWRGNRRHGDGCSGLALLLGMIHAVEGWRSNRRHGGGCSGSPPLMEKIRSRGWVIRYCSHKRRFMRALRAHGRCSFIKNFIGFIHIVSTPPEMARRDVEGLNSGNMRRQQEATEGGRNTGGADA